MLSPPIKTAESRTAKSLPKASILKLVIRSLIKIPQRSEYNPFNLWKKIKIRQSQSIIIKKSYLVSKAKDGIQIVWARRIELICHAKYTGK